MSDPGTASNTVGGSRPAARNLISGNDKSGVLIVGGTGQRDLRQPHRHQEERDRRPGQLR